MNPKKSRRATKMNDQVRQLPSFLELLEPRIAPASLAGIEYKAITLGSPQLLTAGEGLSTSSESGSYILAVEKGQALIYTTDLNGNNQFDPNEITGVSAGDGLRLTSFVDINGDIVTNLQSDGNLSDSDGNAANGRDGLVLLNTKIEGITLRSVTQADLRSGDVVGNRIVLSTYSIFGNVYSGGSIGTTSSAGIALDTSGFSAQTAKFNGLSLDYQFGSVTPSLGAIKTGSAAGGQFFSFGYETVGPSAGSLTTGGFLKPFQPALGQDAGDFIGLRVGDNAAADPIIFIEEDGTETVTNPYTPQPFTIDAIVTGDGGIGARGGDIRDVTLMGDSGGLRIIAGDGGKGVTGGNGGSIVDLADLGSMNGVVQIRTGDGGEGFLGAAGAAGSLQLGEFLMNGDISIGLGNGGNALGDAGAGTNFVNAALKPTDEQGIAQAVSVLSTYREIDDIGSTRSIDFNNDGIGDILFLTSNPGQLGVKFGEANESFGYIFTDDSSPTLYFAAPDYISFEDGLSGVVVADFDGDGYLDIATGASQTISADGIRVFLNPGGNGQENGWIQAANGVDGSNYIDASIRNPLPSLNPYGFLRSGAAVSSIVAGDFDADGIVDLGYSSQSYVIGLSGPVAMTTIVVLKGTGDGRFFGDFQYDRGLNTALALPVLDSIFAYKTHEPLILRATSPDSSIPSFLNPNIIVNTMPGSEQGTVNVVQFIDDGFYAALIPIAGTKPNYDVPVIEKGVITKYNTEQGAPIDISIADIAGDGIFDVVVLNDSSSVTVLGGSSNGLFSSNEGIILVGEQTILGKAKVDFHAVRAFDTLNVSVADPAAFGLYTMGAGAIEDAVIVFELPSLETRLKGLTTDPGDTIYLSLPLPGYNAEMNMFDIYRSDPFSTTERGVVTPAPVSTVPGYFYSSSSFNDPTGSVFFGLGEYNINLVAGEGGTSYLGSGGNGGSLGQGSLSSGGADAVNASISILLPGNYYVQPDIAFRAGGGGSGFLNGGEGGSLNGIFVEYDDDADLLAADIDLIAADGGAGLTGTGGGGGDLSGMKIETGRRFQAGDGGFGYRGGDGGSVDGNSGIGGYTTYNSTVIIFGGAGGFGMASGGHGGSITGFSSEFPVLVGGIGGFLGYTAGDGGYSLAGTGGTGGAVAASSPVSTNNNLVGPILIQSGHGGGGLTGGNGGVITDFSNLSTVSSPVTVVSILSGSGGTGISGNGGSGGLINSIVASGTGIANFYNPVTDQFEDYQYNRIIAGDGGDSYGGTGGAGGTLNNVNTTANSSASAIAGGDGGDGLKRGGDGGSIDSTSADSAAGTAAKVIVWAGSGGHAFAASAGASNVGVPGELSAILNLRAFGGTNGVGGNGGNIVNFSQPKTVNAAVDLVAGNGGSTLNYGFPANTSTGVGRGGSITNVSLAGEAGRISADVRIQAYEEGFVENVLRNDTTQELNDSVGNIGVIVGIAGKVKGDLPAGDAALKTGSVTNFAARSIMSMVAGSVDKIAAINTISGIQLTSPSGVLGAYKTTPVGPTPDHSPTKPLYFSGPEQTGDLVPLPQFGGSLMDGAIVTQNNKSGLTGPRMFIL